MRPHNVMIIPEDVDSDPIATVVLNRVRAEQIRVTISGTISECEKDKLKKRLTKLSGGVAVLMIKIGGASEVEVNEKKIWVQYGVCATRAAVEEGITPGGGSALLHACKALDALETELAAESENQRVRVRILRSVPYPDR